MLHGSGSAGRGRAQPAFDRRDVLGVDEDAGRGDDELGRAADTAVATTERSRGHRLEQRLSEAARRGSAGRRRRRARIQRWTSSCGTRPVRRYARPALERRREAARRRRRRAFPPPSRSNASASRRTFFRSSSEPTQRKAGPSPSQPRAARASVWSPPRKRSRSTPQSTTFDLARARSGRAPRARGAGSARRRSRRTRGGRRPRSRLDAADVPTLRTSRPWAVTTSGAREASVTRSGRWGRGSGRRRRPDFVRRATARASRRSLRYLLAPPARLVEHGEVELVPAVAQSASTSGTRNAPRSGSSGPGHICETKRILTLREL